MGPTSINSRQEKQKANQGAGCLAVHTTACAALKHSNVFQRPWHQNDLYSQGASKSPASFSQVKIHRLDKTPGFQMKGLKSNDERKKQRWTEKKEQLSPNPFLGSSQLSEVPKEVIHCPGTLEPAVHAQTPKSWMQFSRWPRNQFLSFSVMVAPVKGGTQRSQHSGTCLSSPAARHCHPEAYGKGIQCCLCLRILPS